MRNRRTQFLAISMVFPQNLVDFQSNSIDFLSFSISFRQFQSVSISFNQFQSVSISLTRSETQEFIDNRKVGKTTRNLFVPNGRYFESKGA